MLGEQGFAVVPHENIQHFHVYEKNDYQQFPNFVTTDMFMQLFHMYFGFVLRTVEQEQFLPLLTELTKKLHQEFMNKATTATMPDIMKDAEFGATYYAVAYYSFTGKELEVPAIQKSAYENEVKNIKNESDQFSILMDYKDAEFPYSLFKPRGHYTRTDELKRYFKGMMWLQTAPFCLGNDDQLLRAAMLADILAKKPDYLSDYKAVLEPVNFIIGLPDNVSVLQLVTVMKKQNIQVDFLYKDEQTFKNFRSEIKEIADNQNRIKPKK